MHRDECDVAGESRALLMIRVGGYMMVVIYITQQPLKLPFVWYVIYIHRKAVANEYTGLHTCWFKNAGQIHYRTY